MLHAEKSEKVLTEMKRLELDILACTEVRWSGTGEVDIFRIYYTGEDTTQHRNGTGFIVIQEIANSVKVFILVSNRVSLLKFDNQSCPLNLIVAYAPTVESSENDIELFYEEVKKVLKKGKINPIAWRLQRESR